MTTEDARQLILESGWDPGLIQRRLELWQLKAIHSVAMPAIASKLGISERQAWHDWGECNRLIGSAELPRLMALRLRQLSRREHLLGLLMQQIARDQQAGAPVSTDLIRTAERLLVGIEELCALVSHRPEVSIQMTSPFMQALQTKLGNGDGADGHNGGGGNGGPGRDRQGRFARRN